MSGDRAELVGTLRLALVLAVFDLVMAAVLMFGFTQPYGGIAAAVMICLSLYSLTHVWRTRHELGKLRADRL